MSAMTPAPTSLRLTPELVARVARVVEDRGLRPSGTPASDADHQAAIRALFAAGMASSEVWLFAFGSLIWNPACEFVEQRVGLVHGWHRSFCLGWDIWFRGGDEQPGLMLSLDRGGQCHGVAYRLPPDAVEANLLRLFRREMLVRPSAHVPRWVTVRTPDGPLRAIAFTINRGSGRYVGGLTAEAVADALAVAVGPWGSMAEYLQSTVTHLEALGLRDRYLWRLQELVAERIEAATGRPSASEPWARPSPPLS
jgi:cation transport protein ChaC